MVGEACLVGVTLTKPPWLAYTRTMLRSSAKVWLVISSLLAPAALAQEKVEVITLRYHQAEDILPTLLPLVAPNGAITGLRNHLIVRAAPAQQAAVKRVLDTLDVAPRQLEITLRQNVDRAALMKERGVYGGVHGEDGGIVIGGRPSASMPGVDARGGGAHVGAYLNERNIRETTRDTQTLRVLEGRAAFIRIAQSLPYAARNVYIHPHGTTIIDATEYIEAITGFEVLARIVGDRVSLRVRPQKSSPGPHGSVYVQQADTVLSARLGEWVDLGGADAAQAGEDSRLLSRRDGATSKRQSIFIRVDEVR